MPKLPTLAKPRRLPTPAKKHRNPSKPVTISQARTDRSRISSHDYSPETGHLTITFGDGRSYGYSGIDAETAREFSDAPSKGRYLHRHIIGKFDGAKKDP